MNQGIGLDPVPGRARLSPDTAHLLLLNGPLANKHFPLHRIRTVIGRSDPPYIMVDIDLTECELEETRMISRRHAVLEWVNNQLRVTDLGSRNGTYVDEKKLTGTSQNHPSEPAVLKVGSKLVLANLEFEVISHE